MKQQTKYQLHHIWMIFLYCIGLLMAGIGILMSPTAGVGMIGIVPLCYLWGCSHVEGIKEEWKGLKAGGVNTYSFSVGQH